MGTHDYQVIDGTVRSVKDIFTSRTYEIEYYQREYSWQKNNIDALVTDLTRSFYNDYEEGHTRKQVASYRPYFLGPIVTFTNGAISYLVDGQQRLTSLSLFLLYLSTLEEVGESTAAELKALVYSSNYGESQFTIDVPDRESIMSIIRDGHEPKAALDSSSQTIWDRFQDIKQLFPILFEGSGLVHFIDWLRNRVVVVEIGTTDKDMALEIFESMNDRGLQLSSMDLLKSFLLSKITDVESNKKAHSAWKATVQSLVDLTKNGDSDFMKAFLRGKYAQTIRETKKSSENRDFEEIATTFHKWLRDNAEKLNLRLATDFESFIVDDIQKMARHYSRFVSAANTLTKGLEHLYFNNHNDFTLQHMLFMAVVEPNDSEEQADKKANLVATYIDIMLVRRMANYKNFGYSSMYRPMFSLAKGMRGLSLEKLREYLLKAAEEITESIDSLLTLRLTGTNRPEIYYLLARMTTWLEFEASEITDKFFNKAVKDRFEVEHIWANKYEEHLDEFTNPNEFADVRNMFGDLLLLPKSFNASFGALPFSEKVDKYFGQNMLAKSLNSQAYSNNPNFLKLISKNNIQFKPYLGEEFTRSAIAERQDLYLDIAKTLWGKHVLLEPEIKSE